MGGRAKVSDIKAANMKKLKELGYTVKEIAKLTGVSMMTVNDYTLPGFYEKRKKYTRNYLRRTVLLTGPTKADAVKLKHLDKRPYSEECELCGKFRRMHHHYHHWDPSNPSVGLWLCFKCHRLAELVDSLGPRGVIALMAEYEHRRTDVSYGTSKNSSKTVSSKN